MSGELGLYLKFDHPVTYGDVEKALTDAGIINYGIVRNAYGADNYDVQLFIRPDDGSQNLDAVITLQAVSEAVAAMEPEPSE